MAKAKTHRIHPIYIARRNALRDGFCGHQHSTPLAAWNCGRNVFRTTTPTVFRVTADGAEQRIEVKHANPR